VSPPIPAVFIMSFRRIRRQAFRLPSECTQLPSNWSFIWQFFHLNQRTLGRQLRPLKHDHTMLKASLVCHIAIPVNGLILAGFWIKEEGDLKYLE